LKVNFRPLYSDTLEVLSEIGKRHPEILWTIAMAEIDKCHGGDLANLISVSKPEWANENAGSDSMADTDEHLDKSFLCPNANKLYRATERELNLQSSSTTDDEAIEVCVRDSTCDDHRSSTCTYYRRTRSMTLA